LKKRGFQNFCKLEYREVNLAKLKEWIDNGRIDPNELITMKTMRDSGLINRKVGTGVVLLGRGGFKFKHKIEIQVSKATEGARAAIENAGGQVDHVYYNKLGLRAMFMPEWFTKKRRLMPRTVRFIPNKHTKVYEVVGSIPPARIEAENDA